MKTIFDIKTATSLIDRINLLQADSKAQWGKMDAYQMVKHCIVSEQMLQGKKAYKRLFFGRLFGPMTLKRILKDESPTGRNEPTHPDMKITGTGDFEAERKKWIEAIEGYKHFSNDSFIHPFFGKMTKEQIGQFDYKHTDHHLRQFGK